MQTGGMAQMVQLIDSRGHGFELRLVSKFHGILGLVFTTVTIKYISADNTALL